MSSSNSTRRGLITGYGGFVGGHLAEHLLGQGHWELSGTVIDATQQPSWHDERVQQHAVDLRHPEETRALVAATSPDVIFHLAGQAFVPAAWQDPWATIETNVRMQLNLLEAALAMLRSGRTAPLRMLAVTSNEVYGLVRDEDLPVDEDQPLAPANPYATSKAAQDLLALQYRQFAGEGLEVIRLRPFNHIGPRQDPRFVVASFAQQVAQIEAGARPPRLEVGDLSAERDFTDVRDMVRAYRLAAERARPGEVYNLGSGRCHPIQTIVDCLQSLAHTRFEVVPDPLRMRRSDQRRTLCDPSKAERELGWRAEIPLQQTVADVLEDWRGRVG